MAGTVSTIDVTLICSSIASSRRWELTTEYVTSQPRPRQQADFFFVLQWYVGLTYNGATAAAYSDCCVCQNNRA
jgi:hypothetical protein